MFSFFRNSIADRFPKDDELPIGGRPFLVDPIVNMKRDAIYGSPQMGFLTTQDFFEEVDRRSIIVNGEEVEIITRADFDVIGAAIGDKQRHTVFRVRREQPRRKMMLQKESLEGTMND